MGGSIGGIVTAAYLTKYFKRITIIESDDVLSDTFMKSTPNQLLDYRCRLGGPTSLGRSGVSQMYHLHVLESEGHKILQELFPQLKDKLLNEYDVREYSFKTDCRFMVNGFLLNQDLTEDFPLLGIDRFTLETAMRKELCLQYGNQIEWKCNSRAVQLIVDQSLNIIKGIKYRQKHHVDSSSIDLYGDFIIDCTGRNTSSVKWLKESFNLIVPTMQIHFGLGYVTFIGERFKTGDPSLDSKQIVACSFNSPDNNTGFATTPIREIKTMDENSLGTLSTLLVQCVNYEYPPNDSYENLLEWIKEKLGPECYSVFKSTKVCSPLVSYRRAIDDRKYVEQLGKKWPQNYVLLGDAMCTFNPGYAQGMTHACRQARELGKIFQENCHKLKDISHIFNRRASAISEECWLLSTTNDWKTPTLKIVETDKNGEIKIYQRGDDSAPTKSLQPQESLMLQFMQWYTHWFSLCASKSPQLSTDFYRVMTQHSSPSILMKPTTLLTVFYTAFINYFNLSKK
ncbi:unnamed protein product [Rotaria sordida]|uniref:Uncharacterized protein n=1 Tax=Rotaria sordida TaxID=392033 RepID=A0A813Y780_9BILA|nr:unnamed protein product [Rotaria sordida]CAF3847746.1 unnamed protein product [Rotaria sordida]